ncbi:MAG: type II glyceraldehyde-3-phosphate dehydrogenase [Methanosarcinales archaeon Met12]|nr:MAG: type II glyceraldehyde-3-phosphate dehydrogenase [Methanosarcinales archaeon Met12]
MIKVAINGYGTIGKRIADAVKAQDDMEVVGVAKTRPNFEAKLAIERGYDLYAAIPEKCDDFEMAGIDIVGTIYDMLGEADIVVDCTPEGMGAKNKPMYEEAEIKAIFEGGEKHDVAGFSFNAECNYAGAIGRDFVRVVSCNTTGLCRVIHPLNEAFGIKKVRAVLVRRATDPGDVKKGPINAIMPDPVKLPSHHGPDVNTVLPEIDITTMAIKVSTTLMHLHTLNIVFDSIPAVDDVKAVLQKRPRIRFVSAADGLTSTASIIEMGRDMGRPRYDVWENCIWEDSIDVEGGELYFFQAIHQESTVIPENVDAIRAMTNLEKSAEKSMQKTNTAMGLG